MIFEYELSLIPTHVETCWQSFEADSTEETLYLIRDYIDTRSTGNFRITCTPDEAGAMIRLLRKLRGETLLSVGAQVWESTDPIHLKTMMFRTESGKRKLGLTTLQQLADVFECKLAVQFSGKLKKLQKKMNKH